MDRKNQIPTEVRRRIRDRGLAISEAAREIGVGLEVLSRHLDGGYARSDSIAKYNRWLNGGGPVRRPKHSKSSKNPLMATASPLQPTGVKRKTPWKVVDLFSGCGGLSLGFEQLDNGTLFQTQMSADIDSSALACLEQNSLRKGQTRLLDISEVISEAEALALYLDHVATATTDKTLRQALDRLKPYGLTALRNALDDNDRKMHDAIEALRGDKTQSWPSPRSLGQTAATSFMDRLLLPRPTTVQTVRNSAIWGASPSSASRCSELRIPESTLRRVRRQVDRLWEASLRQLTARTGATGRGQLRSSAGRIREFVSWLDSPTGREVHKIWRRWRVRRDALRLELFGSPQVHARLRRVYTKDHEVDVLLGGPPCQGFSRIGRGKIRSLGEQSVHAQYDEESGDIRNRLLHQYVLFVAALRPKIFLFENVSQFKSRVQTTEGGFQADKILEEAIHNISQEHTRYEVAARIIDASKHLVPQTRTRYFMVGVRDPEVVGSADSLLQLPEREEIHLASVLDGMPAAELHNAGPESALSQRVHTRAIVSEDDSSAAILHRWLHLQGRSTSRSRKPHSTDAHVARAPRPDDEQLFRLMGPGSRWMDLHARDSQTLDELRRALRAARRRLNGEDRELRRSLMEVLDKLDEKLPLRLLLESMKSPEGEEEHHLLGGQYMQKGSGNHGDWLSRLAADRPSRTIVSHMAKDTYQYVHPWEPRTLSVREAARIQTFPDSFSFGMLSLVDAYRVIGNAVPPLLSYQLASNIAHYLHRHASRRR